MFIRSIITIQLVDEFWLFYVKPSCASSPSTHISMILHYFFAFLFLTFYLNLASSDQDNPSIKRPCIRIQNGAPKASVDLIARLAAAADKPCSEGK